MKNTNPKKERFERVASRRTQVVLEALESLSKCSNRSHYEYHSDDVDQMLTEIKNKISDLESLYQKGKKTRNTFKFNNNDGKNI